MLKSKRRKREQLDRNTIAMLPDDVLLTEKELCTFLHIGRTTAWRYREQGKIPYVKLGNCVRYHLGSVRKWIQQKTEETV